MGRSTTACSHVNTVVLAPMPRPSDSTAAIVSVGLLIKDRNA
jgi:hypothetical protein